MVCVFCVQEFFASLMVMKFSLMFSSERFIVLTFIFGCFSLIFVLGRIWDLGYLIAPVPLKKENAIAFALVCVCWTSRGCICAGLFLHSVLLICWFTAKQCRDLTDSITTGSLKLWHFKSDDSVLFKGIFPNVGWIWFLSSFYVIM